jgi:hypothetical protein
MTEQEQAFKIAEMWLDGRMNKLVQMVPGDPDCDACVLARQYQRSIEEIETLRKENARYRETLETIAGHASDKLQAAQARGTLA